MNAHSMQSWYKVNQQQTAQESEKNYLKQNHTLSTL